MSGDVTSEMRAGVLRIRRRRLLAYVVVYGGPFVGVLLYLLLPGEAWQPYYLIGWMLSGTVLLILVYESRCPRCRRRFHGSRFFPSIFARECRHCGLGGAGDGLHSSGGQIA